MEATETEEGERTANRERGPVGTGSRPGLRLHASTVAVLFGTGLVVLGGVLRTTVGPLVAAYALLGIVAGAVGAVGLVTVATAHRTLVDADGRRGGP